MGVEGQDPVLCTACGKPEDPHPFQHPFTPPGEPLKLPDPPSKKKKEQGGTTQVIVGAAPDLILRHVMLKSGLVTSEQLMEAERELTLGIEPDGKASDV